MTDKEKIRKEIQRLQDLTMDENKNFYSEAAEGEYNALCNIEHFIDSLQEEPVSEDLEEAAIRASMLNHNIPKEHLHEYLYNDYGMRKFVEGAKWQKEKDDEEKVLIYMHGFNDCKEHIKEVLLSEILPNSLWKDAQGDDLPEIDREVIVLTQNYPLENSEYAVSFAHRPYKGKYIGKSLTTGNIETFENETYDKGGWNQPNVKWWLDCGWPKQNEE